MRPSLIIALAAAGLVGAQPMEDKKGPTDVQILNYALTLEHLEATFYEQGLKNYTHEDFMEAGYQDPFYHNLMEVASDEKSHVDFLTSALSAAGAKPVEACTYAFPAMDVKSFLTVANVLEGVGVSAYLGAAAHIMNETFVTAAGSILTVEARHSAYLRASVGSAPFPAPFDTPLNFNQVYSLASQFLAGCPESNPELPVMAFPPLTVHPSSGVMANEKITVTPGKDFNPEHKPVHAAFISLTGPVSVPLTEEEDMSYTLMVPDSISGQSYLVLTSNQMEVNDDTVLAGPAVVDVTAKKMASHGMGSSGMPMPASTMMMPSGTSWMPSPGMPSQTMMMPTGSDGMPSHGMPSQTMMPTGSDGMPSPPEYTGSAQRLTGGLYGGVAGAAVAVALLV